jgi:hypothetical protein
MSTMFYMQCHKTTPEHEAETLEYNTALGPFVPRWNGNAAAKYALQG